MSIIKSMSVGRGDLFYINHDSDNFTIIDCNIGDEDRDEILTELKSVSYGKGIYRFISTHPDEDHIHGLEHIDDEGMAYNFYCVRNKIEKDDTDSFKRYKKLREDPKRSFYIRKGCSRRWMNEASDERGSSGINALWPIDDNAVFLEQLDAAEDGGNANNICPILSYSLQGGATAVWMGDLESTVMEQIVDCVDLPKTDILFAPHHGRKSAHVIKDWLEAMDPKVIVVGEAPSEDLEYYNGYNTITQNSAGDIEFECVEGKVNVRVSSSGYTTDFLSDAGAGPSRGDARRMMYYVGSFDTYSC